MFLRGLKTNVILTLAILLFLAMLLVDFVLIIMTQRELVRAEIDKGIVLLRTVSENMVPETAGMPLRSNEAFFTSFEALVNDTGYHGLIVQADNGRLLWSKCPNITLQKRIDPSGTGRFSIRARAKAATKAAPGGSLGNKIGI